MVERADNQIIRDVPGGDIVKTLIFIIFTITIFFILCGPFSPPEIPAAYSKLTTTCLLFGILLCAFSAAYARFVQTSRADDLKKGYKILYPKVILEAGMFLVFLVICFWTIILGGILFSPFGSILIVSPIFFLIEFFRLRDVASYIKLVQIINRGSKSMFESGALGKVEQFLIRTINCLNIAILVLVLFTVIVGECLVKICSINLIIYRNAVAQIMGSSWFLIVSYIIYYFSLAATFIAIIPRSYTMNWTKKLLL